MGEPSEFPTWEVTTGMKLFSVFGMTYVLALAALLLGGAFAAAAKYLRSYDLAVYPAAGGGVVALVLVVVSIVSALARIGVLRHAVPAQAGVVDVRESKLRADVNAAVLYTLELEVHRPAGGSFRALYEAGVHGDDVKPGDKLDVIYDSRLPDQVEIPKYMPGQPVFDTQGFIIRPTSPASVWGFAAMGVVMFAAWLAVVLW